jgi:predicted phosphoribosyltransferase/predicted alpha/beta-hydrolase family hydrolase
MLYTDRRDAGRRLAERLEYLRSRDLVVVGLPRGGVVVAHEVARGLGAPLDVIIVRKLGAPFQPELAMGAISEGGVRIIDRDVVRRGRVPDVESVERHEQAELRARVERWRASRPPLPLDGRTVVIVDDGIATGATARAACRVARARGADRVVMAVPVAAHDVAKRLGDVADEIVCLCSPGFFYAVGQSYQDFSQVSDDEVTTLLLGAVTTSPRHDGDPGEDDAEVVIEAGAARLGGRLTVPAEATGLVVFAHGSGSSRHSPRNLKVAEALNRAGLGTLLFDLLTEREGSERARVFDIPPLAACLLAATGWLRGRLGGSLPVGYFGASTGAAAALWAAADPEARVSAVVSRGGRPDLAAERLPGVQAPTLLIVGGRDPRVLDLNKQAAARMTCETRLLVVPDATHLFEEPGALEAVAEQAADWFLAHLG